MTAADLAGPALAFPVLAAAAVALVAVVAAGALAVRARAAARAGARERDRADALTARLRVLTHLTGAGLLVQSADGRVLELDERAADALGVTASDAVGRRLADLSLRLVDEGGRPVLPAAVLGPLGARGPGGGPRGAVVVGVPGDDGDGVRRVHVESRPLPDTARGAHGAGAVLTVLTPVGGPGGDRTGVALHDAAQVAPVAIALAGTDGRVLEANRAFAELAGAGLEAHPDVDLSAAGDGVRAAGGTASPPTGWHAAVAELTHGGRHRVELEQQWARADGRVVSVVLDLALASAADGGSPRVAVVARDVTADRERSDALTHRALHDPLTGLANRALLLGTLQSVLERAGAESRVAVLACDLDGFKPINDRYGHAAGDDVLVHVASVLRAATGARGTVARLGGDEFVIVLDDPDSARAALEVAGAIHAGLREPVVIQRDRVPVRASVGVALASSVAAPISSAGLLAAADTALYRAKGGGRSRTEVYDLAVDHAGAPAGVAGELAGALERDELTLHVQPVVALADGRVAGEAVLVRWAHPARGLLPAAAFAAAVQEAGLSAAVARHTVAGAVEHLAQTADPGRWVVAGVDLTVLARGEIARTVLDELGRRGVDPRRLVLALEGGTLDGVDRHVRSELARLRAAGVRVLLDRFGAGLPPLGALRDLPVDGLRLDPSFTSGVVDDPAAARVVRAVGAMARELDVLALADGVDTPEQAEIMAAAGWQYAQGWAFGGPQPPRHGG